MMDNYERTLELVDIAQNSSGASAEQFTKTYDSVQTKLNNIQASFEQFIGTVIQNDFVKGLLDAINNVLQFINDIADQGGVAFTAFATVAIVMIKKIVSNFVSGMRTASNLASSAWDKFFGDYLNKMKDNNQKSIDDLENRIRKSGIAKAVSEEVATGIRQGVAQAQTGVASGAQNQNTTQESAFTKGLSKKTARDVRSQLQSGQWISESQNQELQKFGFNVSNLNGTLEENQQALLKSLDSYEAQYGTMTKFQQRIETVGPAISSMGSAISSVVTSLVVANAATKGTTALGGATAGSAVGSVIGALGYAIPHAGVVLGPLFSSLGGTFGALLGEGIATGLDNAKYGIGSQESIKGFQEQASKVAEETSQSIEENQGLIDLGEEYISLSEKINLTNEEKERLAELNEQLIDQWDGLGYVNSSENGLRAINIDQLKEEIKLKKQLIAEDTARATFSNYNVSRAEQLRENTDAEEAAREALRVSLSNDDNMYKRTFQVGEKEINAIDEINRIFGTDYTDKNEITRYRTPTLVMLNNTVAEADVETLTENKDAIVNIIQQLGENSDSFTQALEQYEEVVSSNREKLDALTEEFDQDIQSVVDMAYSGIEEGSFSVLNKSHLNELLKAENILSEDDLDRLASGGLNYEEILERRTEIAQDFINNLDSFNEREQEVFSNAISMIGLFRDENGEVDSDRISDYITSELGATSDAVQNAFNQVFEAESETLSDNWNQLLGANQKYIDEFAETYSAEVAAVFAQMTIKAGDQAPAFITAFQEQYDKLLRKYINAETGEFNSEKAKKEFEEIADLLSSTDVTSANSIAKLSYELEKLGMAEEEVFELTSSLGSVFSRSGLTAEEALEDIQTQLEKVDSLISIIGDNLEASLSLDQLDQFNSILENMGMNLLDASQIVATADGFQIQGNVGGIISSGTEGTREYLLNMANQANAAKFMKEQLAAQTDDLERRNQLLDEASEYEKSSTYYLAAEAQIRAKTIQAQIQDETEEKQRLYDLVQQYKNMIAEMERYYNLQRKILQLQNEQTDLELDLDLAKGSSQVSEIFQNQILNLVEQQALLKQAGEIYANDLKQLGDYINRDFGQFLTVDESGNIFQNTDELVKLAERMKGASEEESEELQRQWDTIAEVQSAYEDLYDTAISNSQDYKKNLKEQQELEEQIRDYQIELEQTLRDMIIAEMEAEVEAVKEKYDKIKEEDQKYLTSLQKNINKRKQMQSDQDQEEEIQTIQNRIGLLSRDTSGIYTKEIEDLQEELDQLLQERENTALDRLYEEEEAKTQKVAEELNLRSEYLQNQLDHELETYEISNQKVADLLKMKDEEILVWMTKHSEEFARATTAEQQKFIETWERQIELGRGAQDTLTTNLEENKVAILNKFQEIKTGGIDVYIKAMDEANKAKIVVKVDDSQIKTALAELDSLENKKNEFVKNEAKRELDTLLVDIERAYAQGNKAEGQRLQEEYQNVLSLFSSYRGEYSEMARNSLYNAQNQYGGYFGYKGAEQRAEEYGTNSYNTSHATGNVTGNLQYMHSYGKMGNFELKNRNNEQGYFYIDSSGENKRIVGDSLDGEEMIIQSKDTYKLKGDTVQQAYYNGEIIYVPTKFMNKLGSVDWLYSYATGGMVDYTGPAWVDGTPSKPEAFLSAADTENIAKLRDILSKVFNSSNLSSTPVQNQNNGDAYYEFHITVDELGKDYTARDMMTDLEKYINQQSNYRNVINIKNRK